MIKKDAQAAAKIYLVGSYISIDHDTVHLKHQMSGYWARDAFFITSGHGVTEWLHPNGKEKPGLSPEDKRNLLQSMQDPDTSGCRVSSRSPSYQSTSARDVKVVLRACNEEADIAVFYTHERRHDEALSGYTVKLDELGILPTKATSIFVVAYCEPDQALINVYKHRKEMQNKDLHQKIMSYNPSSVILALYIFTRG